MSEREKSMIMDQEKDIDLNELVKPYLKKWRWFFLSTILFIFLAFLYLKKNTPIYKLTTSVLIKDARNSSGGSDIGGIMSELSSFGGSKTSSVDNEIEVFKSKKLMRDVVKELNLQTDIFVEDGLAKIELYKESSPIKVNVINEKSFSKWPKKSIELEIKGNELTLFSEELKTIKSQFGKTISLPYANIIITKNLKYNPLTTKEIDVNHLQLNIASLEGKVSGIQSLVDVELANKDVTVIELSMDYAEISKAEDILNALVDSYNKDAVDDKNVESKKTIDFIDERIGKLSSELGVIEDEKEAFKSKNKITDLYTEAKISLETSAKAKEKELELESQLDITNSLLGYVSKKGSYDVLPLNIGLESSEASSNIILYNQLVQQRNRLLENATPQNPTVVDVTNQINSIRSSVVQSLQKSRDGLLLAKNEYTKVQNEIDGEIEQVPALEKNFRNIERQQGLKEGLYLMLLRKREEAAISQSIVVPKARIIDPAFASDKPIAPKKMIILLGALALGLIFPLALIYFRELLNNKLQNKHQLESYVHSPVIAELPKVNKKNDIIKPNDLSPLSETFRILLTNLKFMLPDKDTAKHIFVTSTIKGEGKTFVSLNLGITLAASKSRVLIIGSDIRNPQLQRYDVTKKNVIGLSEYLYDSSVNVKEIIHKKQFDSLCDVIYSGVIPPNPVELLSNGRYELLLNEIANDYDYIILDTAPLLLVTDTLLISNLADAFVYVVRSRYTDRKLIDFANNAIETKKIKNVAFVLNDVDKNSFGYGNKYGYGYSNESRSFLQKLKDYL